jgi:hypothetical protein
VTIIGLIILFRIELLFASIRILLFIGSAILSDFQYRLFRSGPITLTCPYQHLVARDPRRRLADLIPSTLDDT